MFGESGSLHALEMAEACAAISAGEKDHAKQELAQVCAVAIRMMYRLDVNGKIVERIENCR